MDLKKLFDRRVWLSTLVILIPFLLLTRHFLIFGNWLIDDAAISFAYSRNLAHGYGLVSQPGVPPLEGYSNFLWVALVAVLYLIHVFDPVWTSKIVGALLALILYVLIFRVVRVKEKRGLLTAMAILLCLSMNGSFALWTVSGLENPLYVLMSFMLFYVTYAFISLHQFSTKLAITAGCLAALTALCRPDGVMYFALFPVALGLTLYRSRATGKWAFKPFLLNGVSYALPLCLLYGGYLLFRICYFHDIYPNTYYVKGAPKLDFLYSTPAFRLLRDLKLKPFVLNMLGTGAPFYLGAITLLSIYLIIRKQFRDVHLLSLIFFATAFGIYVLLPRDWMSCWRFATPMYPFFFVYVGLVLDSTITSLTSRSSIRNAAWGLIVLLAGVPGYIAGLNYSRQLSLSTPYARVTDQFGQRYDQFAAALQIKDASVLIPDLGGILLNSKVRVYDWSGLCDRTIAKTRCYRQDKKAFMNYIYEDIKPTFILMKGGALTWQCPMDADPRFDRDYVPIYSYIHRYPKENTKYKAGDFVRRDAIRGREALLVKAQEIAMRYVYFFQPSDDGFDAAPISTKPLWLNRRWNPYPKSLTKTNPGLKR